MRRLINAMFSKDNVDEGCGDCKEIRHAVVTLNPTSPPLGRCSEDGSPRSGTPRYFYRARVLSKDYRAPSIWASSADPTVHRVDVHLAHAVEFARGRST
jgi:hypothetical protein